MSQNDATNHSESHEELLASRFEERAEHLSRQELSEWTRFTDRDHDILAKIKGPGAKLVSGPRGSGKSTLLRKAYYDLLDNSEVICAYINFSKSLALEPLFHSRSDAAKIFRQWVIAKILIGLAEVSEATDLVTEDSVSSLFEKSALLIRSLERGDSPALSLEISASQLLGLLERIVAKNAAKRCVLLLDDAAHAFSPEQQREFFEIFRELRSRTVSLKAAVYPGVTSYSSNFHVGHEAELVEVWYMPEGEEYLSTMRSIAKQRLTPEMFALFEGREELLDLLALAAFGLPRGFLYMLSHLIEAEYDATKKPTRNSAEKAISAYASSVHGIHTALSQKLPRYKHFVQTGERLQKEVVVALRKFNLAKPLPRKAATLGLPEPISEELRRVLSFLEYSGVVRKMGVGSRGQKGTYHRYRLHYALVISENALSLGRSYTVTSVIQSLRDLASQAMIRSSAETLLGQDYKSHCRIDLAPCPKCRAPRMFEEAKFCMQCGTPLAEVSIYEQLLEASIEDLPLTTNKIASILEHTPLRTVQDILLDEDNQTIRGVPRIGPIWAGRIRTAAEEYVSV